MAIDVKLPDLGEGIESGDVLEIYVSVGDTIAKEQGLIELETDKATVTVPSPRAGRVSKILVKQGQSVPVGSVIVELEAESSAPSASVASEPQSPSAASKTADSVAHDSPKPTSASTPSESSKPSKSGISGRTSISIDMDMQPSQSVRAESVKPPAPNRPKVTTSPAPTESPTDSDDSGSSSAAVAASPAIRRFAREVGVDLTSVQGSGEGGRISRDDVLRAVREASTRANSGAKAANVSTSQAPQVKEASEFSKRPTTSSQNISDSTTSLPGTPGQDDYGPIRTERLTKIRKTIATQMHKSWSTAPQVTNFDDADVTELEAIRASSKDDYAARGIKLTSLPFLLKAVATALRNHPTMNGVLDLENEQVIYRDYVNLGVAVDTPRGLVVPNIRNAHLMSIPDIAKAMAEMAHRVRSGDFGVSDLRGGTFTISNLGAIGGTYSTPIVNVPEVGILLVGRTRKLPVVMGDDSLKIRQMMPLSLSYDHRLVDGATAARFLNEVISLLESPSRLLLAIS